MRRLTLGLALLALPLTAGRAAAEAHCVSDIRDAAPDGSFCKGHIDAMNGQAQQPAINPAAATQLTNLAGGVAGSILGNALVTPLANQYQGHKPVKPVVTDGDGIVTPGIGAAGDVISGYKPQDDSFAARLAHFRELHDAEMDQRRAALEKLKGTGAEKWCKAHIGILFPEPPVVNVVNSYPNKVRAYDREKQIWDKRCGGPSAQPGYASFTEELAALKRDEAPAAVAGTTAKAPTYEAPAPAPAAPQAEPEKPADSFADAEKELEGPSAKKSAAVAEAPSAPPAQSAPAGVRASPDSGPAPDDSKNTNHATEFFGEKNAKVTAKDLADTRAPELDDLRPGTGSAGGSGGGAQWSGIPQAKGMPSGPAPDIPRSWGTPEEVAAMTAPKRPAAFPDPMAYLSRAMPFLKSKAEEKAESEVKSGTKKALIAELGGLEGRILYNMFELPDYVLSNVLRAAKGDLNLKQADWLTAGAANVLYNIDALPNDVLAKIAAEGDALKGIAAYAKDTAIEKSTDLAQHEVAHDAGDAVSKLHQKLKYGAIAEAGPGGQKTNRLATQKQDAWKLSKQSLVGAKVVSSALDQLY